MPLMSAKSRRRSERRAFNARRRAGFYLDMASALDADLPPFQVLARMHVVARRNRRTSKIAALYRRVLRAMDKGSSLAKSLAPELPAQEGVMLVGADTAGPDVLQKAFHQLSALVERQIAAKKQLRKALILNGITIAVIIGVAVFIAKMAVPQLEAATTPDMRRLMMFAPSYFTFANHVMSGGVVFLVVLGLLAALVVWSLPNWCRNRPGWKRTWFDSHLIPWTLYARTQATFFLATTAAMMRSGIPLKTVLTDMLPHSSRWMRKHLRTMLSGLDKGQSEVSVLNNSMLPQDTRDRLAVYELIPDFTGVMTKLSEDNFRIYEERIAALDAVLRLVSIVVLAIFILSTLFAVFDFSSALTAASSAHGIG